MARVPAWLLGSMIWGDLGLQASAFADDPNPHRKPQVGDLDWNSLRIDYVSQTDTNPQQIASALTSSVLTPSPILGYFPGYSGAALSPGLYTDNNSLVFKTPAVGFIVFGPPGKAFSDLSSSISFDMNARSIGSYDGAGNKAASFGVIDPTTGSWFRGDGSNMVVSTKVGDIYNGFSGRVGLTHRFMDGSATDNIALLSTTNCNLKTPTLGTFFSKTSDPTTTDIPAGQFAMFKNTTSGTLKLWANDGGTMKSVALV